VPHRLLCETTRKHSVPFAKTLGTGCFAWAMTTADPAVVRKFSTDCYGLRGMLMLHRTFPRNQHFVRHFEYVGAVERDERPQLFVADVERLERLPRKQYPDLCWYIHDMPSLALQRRAFDRHKHICESASLVEAIDALFWVAGQMGRTYLDIHLGNIMLRPSTGDLVFSDPFICRDWTE
jgi:hypothetical protein